ncbi:HpcH/HpaI aldolase/citrate lyase family protein [Neobacillus sp. PS3-34]|uniref:HpcH/HpaI aldolase/citrate lyase family protein n=1 Tax=Neobacillus sp. PS3-34 TaxID=3070678 RepID=UPI0027E04EDC|nr:HpcH/HpaI aldolase/citrate lyase family protein [Neobacillus sp. PS3-34]WML47778.1 HpcH/HpaI aldolase/citrate lyase family protein [Neobacillus sp. PS3-34]
MRFFSYFYEKDMSQLFYQTPLDFNKFTNRELLAYALGATLYMPATRTDICVSIMSNKHEGLTSLVIDLEDAIGDSEIHVAEDNLLVELFKLFGALKNGNLTIDQIPLLFIRVRNLEQFKRIQEQAGESMQLLTGLVLPKFEASQGKALLEEVKKVHTVSHPFYAMPILETKKVIRKETRMKELMDIKGLLDEYRDNILNVRIGATDFSGLYGIRRSADMTVYDIAVLRDCIADIINVFLRADSPYVISGPVWEYFSAKERILKPQLRQTPFRERYGREGLKWRTELIGQNLDGLLKEVLMDISNGLTGKTIIHPTHIKAVQAMNVVSYEEYMDANTIINAAAEEYGAVKSQFSNKMNEIKPHTYWAEKILLKSKVYGVLHEEHTNIDLLRAKVYV